MRGSVGRACAEAFGVAEAVDWEEEAAGQSTRNCSGWERTGETPGGCGSVLWGREGAAPVSRAGARRGAEPVGGWRVKRRRGLAEATSP